MNIIVDSNEKAQAITKILSYFKKQGIEYERKRLNVGDYMLPENPLLSIDRKQNLSELYSNLCHDKKRFKNEFERAKSAGIKLIILCEHGEGINRLLDVKKWVNPRATESKFAWNGDKLFREIYFWIKRYDSEILFCDKGDTGRKIIEMLTIASKEFLDSKGCENATQRICQNT